MRGVYVERTAESEVHRQCRMWEADVWVGENLIEMWTWTHGGFLICVMKTKTDKQEGPSLNWYFDI